MSADSVIILSRGGMPGLVAATLALQEIPARHLILLHFDHPTRHAGIGLDHLERQAGHLGGARLVRGTLGNIGSMRSKDPDLEAVPLEPVLLLSAALSAAVSLGARRIIWPRRAGGHPQEAAHAAETVTLVSHLAELERTEVPGIEAPLLELEDLSFMELGMQLNAPWQLAWSCDLEGPHPCRACAGCRRRHHLFAQVCLRDPSMEPVRQPA